MTLAAGTKLGWHAAQGHHPHCAHSHRRMYLPWHFTLDRAESSWRLLLHFQRRRSSARFSFEEGNGRRSLFQEDRYCKYWRNYDVRRIDVIATNLPIVLSQSTS